MKAIRIHEPTGFSGLVYEDAPDATPVAGDVLVKVAACGITKAAGGILGRVVLQP